MNLSNLLLILCLAFAEGCPEGWESIPEHDPSCYLIVTDNKLQWSEAKQVCEDLKADLFLPRNFEIESKVWNLYQSKGDVIDRLWIDAIAQDPSNPLDYTSSNGRKLNYTNWLQSPKQPNNPNSKAFIGISGSNPPKWIDLAGERDFDFVCQKSSEDTSGPNGNDCFEKDVIFVENSIERSSIEECRDLCLNIFTCKVI